MDYFIGFIIAFLISLTGIGAGTVTVPVLVLFLGVPSSMAIAIGLTFSSAVKLILVPAQIARKNVIWSVLGYMVLGGIPGVLIGSLLLQHLVTVGSQSLLGLLLGVILISIACWQILFMICHQQHRGEVKNRSSWMPWLMLPVGAEVGFSSAGAGALGSIALLTLTPLSPAQVVGTDIVFGFVLSLLGSGAHWFSLSGNLPLLYHLIEGGLIGGVFGTLLGQRIPRRPLRFALWVWIFLLGSDMILNNFHKYMLHY